MTSMSDGMQIETVVVVNDDPTQRCLMTGLLHKEGLKVTSFASVEEALASMVVNPPPDLLVTDLHMPTIDGWRFCRLLRSTEFPAYNKTPIVVASSTFSGGEAQNLTEESGANAFLPLPLNMGQWRQMIQSLKAGDHYVPPCPVLIIDDDRSFGELLTTTFARRGYSVTNAETGEAGLGLITENSDGLVLLDLHLPDISGSEVLARIHQIAPNLVVVIITGDPTPELALQLIHQGAAAYLRKPIDPQYLLEVCERTLRERALLKIESCLAERTRALQLSENRFSTLFTSMVSSFAVLGMADNGSSFRFIEINPAFERLIGLVKDEVIGKSALSIMTDLDPQWVGRFAAIAQGQDHAPFEYHSPKLDKHFEGVVFNTGPGQIGLTFVDVTQRKRLEIEREQLIKELQDALAQVKSLNGLLPICAGCKKIRDDQGYWERIEHYIQKHTDARFSHGLCPDCVKKYYPEVS